MYIYIDIHINAYVSVHENTSVGSEGSVLCTRTCVHVHLHTNTHRYICVYIYTVAPRKLEHQYPHAFKVK